MLFEENDIKKIIIGNAGLDMAMKTTIIPSGAPVFFTVIGNEEARLKHARKHRKKSKGILSNSNGFLFKYKYEMTYHLDGNV